MVIPFAGSEAEARGCLEAVADLQRTDGDELVVVDNGGRGAVEAAVLDMNCPPEARVVDASVRRSSYYARNAGTDATEADWLLFIDADCRPRADLLDRFFDSRPAAGCGALAGLVLPAGSADRLVERHARSRGLLDQRAFLERPRPFAVTANLLVRRAALERLEGFAEVRSGGDVDLSWRLAEHGWTVELREQAIVEHEHRATLKGLLRQRARYGAGARWLELRHPGSRPAPRPLRGAARSAQAAVGTALQGAGEEAAFNLIDAAGYIAHAIGRRMGNEL